MVKQFQLKEFVNALRKEDDVKDIYSYKEGKTVSIIDFKGVKEKVSVKGNKYKTMEFIVQDEEDNEYLLSLPSFVVKKYIEVLQAGGFKVSLDDGVISVKGGTGE